jgi:hypothetical protein
MCLTNREDRENFHLALLARMQCPPHRFGP